MLERWAAAAWTSRSGTVGCNGAVGGEGSDGRSGGASIELVEAGRPVEFVEPRRVDREGGDVRSEEGVKVADAANPLCAAVRLSGREGALPSKVAVWLRVRRVGRGASLGALIAYVARGV